MQLIKMGLIIFNYLLDNILIDSESLGYFNYRKLINIFQHNLLFQMMNITRMICKYFLASSLRLEGALLVKNPTLINLNPLGQDVMISNESNNKPIFNTKNVIYSQVMNMSNILFVL